MNTITKVPVTRTVRLDEFPADLHIKVKRYQLEKAEQGIKVTFPEACLQLIEKALTA